MAIKVLIVDDSRLIRQMFEEMLSSVDEIDVVGTAVDAFDARNKIKELKPDVITLDIEMPKMDGFELASIIRSESQLKDIPIIMITSRTGQKHKERAMSIGVNDYMGKPFGEEILLNKIGALIDIESRN